MKRLIKWELSDNRATHYDVIAGVFCNERGFFCRGFYKEISKHRNWETDRYVERGLQHKERLELI